MYIISLPLLGSVVFFVPNLKFEGFKSVLTGGLMLPEKTTGLYIELTALSNEVCYEHSCCLRKYM